MSTFFILSIINRTVFRLIQPSIGISAPRNPPSCIKCFLFLSEVFFFTNSLKQCLCRFNLCFSSSFQRNISVQHVQHAVADTMNEFLSRNVYYMISFMFTILYFFERFYSLLTLMYSVSHDSRMKQGGEVPGIYIGTNTSPVSPGNIFVLSR